LLTFGVSEVEALQQVIRFLSRRFGPPRLALCTAGWLVALGLWGAVARNTLPVEHRSRWDAELSRRAPLYARFDSGWYLSIIEKGYGAAPPPGQPSAHAFFPLYPFAARALHVALGLDAFLAGLAVAYLGLFLAMPVFFREAVERLGEADAWHAVLFLLLWPIAFYLQAMYAESLFLLFALLAFREARAGRGWRACLWGVLLGFTRASAVAAGPALFLAALFSPAAGGRRAWAKAAAVGAAPVVTALGWIYGMGLSYGEPGLYFRSMEAWRRPASSAAGVMEWFSRMIAAGKYGYWMRDPSLALDYGLTALVAVVAVWLAWKRRWPDAAWAGCAVGLPITTGISGGLPRFLLVVYPVYFALAEGSSRSPRARLAFWIASGGLLLWASGRFVNWMWVA
jgi:hypothetical protein